MAVQSMDSSPENEPPENVVSPADQSEHGDVQAESQRSSSVGIEETFLLAAGDASSSAPLDQALTQTRRRKAKRIRRRNGSRHLLRGLGETSSAPLLPRHFTQWVYTLQNALSRILPTKLPPKTTLLALYISHFLSRWTNRMWEFAVPMFLLDASYAATSASSHTGTSGSSTGSASLLLVALYGLSESLAMSLFSVPIGTWVDLSPRLPLAASAIAAQNAALFLAAIAVACLLSFSELLAAPYAAGSSGNPDLVSWVAMGVEKGADVALVAVVCVLGATAALSGLARGIAVERDWAVVIADWVSAQEGEKRGSEGHGEQREGEEERKVGEGVRTVAVQMGNQDDEGSRSFETLKIRERVEASEEAAFAEKAGLVRGNGASESSTGADNRERERQVQADDEGNEHHCAVRVEGGDCESDAGERGGAKEGDQTQQQQQQQQREGVRARLNSTLRTIDLLCRLLAPALTGALMAAASSAASSATSSTSSPSSPPLSSTPSSSPAAPLPELLPVSLPLAMAAWFLLAAAAELLLLALVHSQVPALGEGKKGRGGGAGIVEEERGEEEGRGGVMGEGSDGEEVEDEEVEEEEGEEEKEEAVLEQGGKVENEKGDEQLLTPFSSSSSSTPLVSSSSLTTPIDPTTNSGSPTPPSSSSSTTKQPHIRSTTQPSTTNPSLLHRLLSSLHHLSLLLSSWLTTLRTAWTVYIRQASLLPSLALSLLYLTVLSFGSLMCAYLHSQGIHLTLLGSASGAAAVTGVLGAAFFPSLCARLGPSRTAEASVWSQLACLLPCVVAGLVLQSSGPIPAVLLIIGVVLSRAPLWIFDLSVLQIVQGAVVEEERGAVGGVQESLQQGMQLVALVLAAVVSRPRDFWVLTTVSGVAVTGAAVLVTVDRRGRGFVGRIMKGEGCV